MFKKVLAVTAIALMLSSCSGHIGGQTSIQDVRDTKPQKYCGPNLAKTLALLCYEENAEVGKRSGYNAVYNAVAPPLYKSEEVPYWPWLPAEKARSMGLPTRGKRYIGVVDECCFKACSIVELTSYC